MNRTTSLRRRAAVATRLGVAAIVTAVVASIAAAPQTAEACDCAPRIDVTAAEVDGSFPSNGLLLVEAECGGDPSDLAVWVDGQPASLWPERDRMLGLGYRISPPPPPGAFVEIEGCPGFARCDEAAAAAAESAAVARRLPPDAVSLAFTVGEPDRTTPAAPVLQDLDYLLHDDPDPEPCFGEPEGPAREWSLALDGQALEPVLYHVSLGPSGPDEPTRTRRVVLDGHEDLELTLRRAQEDAGRDVCATVRTFDLTGNEAESVRLCRPLGRDETLDGLGCACAADRRGSGPLGVLLVLGLGAMRRRRARGR